MPQPHQADMRNRLLRSLSAGSYALLQPHLEPVALVKGDIIFEAGIPFAWAYFPESGLASVISRTDGGSIEVGLFGRDGMGSTALVLGTDRTPHETVIQVDGCAHRLPADILRRAMAQDTPILTLLLRYVQAFSLQVAQTALSNGRSTIEQRLARWLLVAHDHLDGDDVPLTHDYLAVMLGVRRPGVTLATHLLEGEHLIRAKRGVITVIDRIKLEQLAGDAYGPTEAEYERLIGPVPPRAEKLEPVLEH